MFIHAVHNQLLNNTLIKSIFLSSKSSVPSQTTDLLECFFTVTFHWGKYFHNKKKKLSKTCIHLKPVFTLQGKTKMKLAVC